MPTFTKQIAASAGDASQRGDDSNFNLVGNSVLLGEIGGATSNGGFHFLNVTVPPAAKITSAKVTFTTLQAATNVLLKVSAHAIDDAPVFADSANEHVNDRTLTSAAIDFDGAWSNSGTEDTPDIGDVIQEIIDRSGWVSGNAIAIIIKDDGSGAGEDAAARAYDHTPANSATLEIVYVAPLTSIAVNPAQKRKRFIFQVKSRTGSFLHATEAWDFQEIVREVNGSMSVTLLTDILGSEIGEGIVDLMNRIDITISSSETGSAGLNYFSGYIPQRIINLRAEDERVNLSALGHASLLFETLYRDGTTIVIDKTGASAAKASAIVSDILDKVQTLDSNWPVDEATGTVEDSTDSVQDKFKLQTAGDALNRCVFLAFDTDRIWYWLVMGDNVFHFKKASTTADHLFTYKHDVLDFPELSEDLKQSKNEVFVQYNAGANVRRRADATSITSFGNRSLVVTEANVATEATADEIGDAYLNILAPPIRNVRVTVNDLYDKGIENIDPGDTCRILNLPTEIQDLLTLNMFIVRTTYRKDHVELELSLQHPQIDSQVEHIRRRLNQEQTDDMTATTYA